MGPPTFPFELAGLHPFVIWPGVIASLPYRMKYDTVLVTPVNALHGQRFGLQQYEVPASAKAEKI